MACPLPVTGQEMLALCQGACGPELLKRRCAGAGQLDTSRCAANLRHCRSGVHG